MTRNWLSAADGIGFNVGAPWGANIYEVTTTDPVKTISAETGCKTRALPANLALPAGGISFRENDKACGDGMVVTINKITNVIEQIRGFHWNGGNPTGVNHHSGNLKDLGQGTRTTGRAGSISIGVNSLFGLLRGEEINTVGMPIRHALQISLPWNKPGYCPAMLAARYIAPAVDMDTRAPELATGTIPYGSLIALPPESKGGPNLDSLGLSEPGRRLAEALRTYGAYVVDSTTCPNFRTDQFVTNTGALKEDMKKLYRYFRIVTNSAWESGGQSVGGGEPLGPNCAFDAP